jgi:two-component system, OmpR family, response regulator
VSVVCVVAEDRAQLRLLGRAVKDGGIAVDLFDRLAYVPSLAASRRYDLLLLDVDHPDCDDVAMLELVRDRSPATMTIVLSSRNDPPHRVRCLDAGASDFVGKPYDLSELLARVRAHLRWRTDDGITEFLDDTEARLDVLRREMVLADRKITLPPREFLLLRHLMSKRGQVCTRQELLKEVWGYDFAADTNVVDKYVSRLRRKLPADLIETVRHVGYTYGAA